MQRSRQERKSFPTKKAERLKWWNKTENMRLFSSQPGQFAILMQKMKLLLVVWCLVPTAKRKSGVNPRRRTLMHRHTPARIVV